MPRFMVRGIPSFQPDFPANLLELRLNRGLAVAPLQDGDGSGVGVDFNEVAGADDLHGVLVQFADGGDTGHDGP